MTDINSEWAMNQADHEPDAETLRKERAPAYTRPVTIETPHGEFFDDAWIKEDADLDGRFKAWIEDEGCFYRFNGWDCTVEEGH
jgi:hypothetical protein